MELLHFLEDEGFVFIDAVVIAEVPKDLLKDLTSLKTKPFYKQSPIYEEWCFV